MVSSFNSSRAEEIVKLKHLNIKNRRILRSYQHTTSGAPRIIYLTPSYSPHIESWGGAVALGRFKSWFFSQLKIEL